MRKKSLKDFSAQELKDELERRKRENELPRPAPLENPDFEDLVAMVRDGVEDTDRKGYEDEDFKHYVYEAVLDAIYGRGVYFNWLKQRVRNK